MKEKTGIAVLAVLLVVSVIGNVFLYSIWRTSAVNNASLEEDVATLQNQVTSLQSEVSSLQIQVNDLSNENAELKAADVQYIDTMWSDNHPLLGSPYVHVWGTVVNFGQETAYNVVVTVKIYEEAVLLKTENIRLEDIWGEWYGKFDVNINYSGDATSVDLSISHS